jgi:hypothetical protein
MADSIGVRVVFNIFKISLFIIAGVLFLIAWYFNKDNLTTDNWPTAKGIIYSSNIVEQYSTLLGRKYKHYDLDIDYGYIVDNKKYEGKGLFINSDDKNIELDYYKKANDFFNKNPKTFVYYNPENPQESYLVKKLDYGTRSFYKISRDLLFFAIFLYLITPILRLFRDKKYIKDNSFEQGLIVPDDVKRVDPFRHHR